MKNRILLYAVATLTVMQIMAVSMVIALANRVNNLQAEVAQFEERQVASLSQITSNRTKIKAIEYYLSEGVGAGD